MLDLPEKLPLIKYWKIDEILEVYDPDEDESPKSSNELKEDIRNAINEGKLECVKSNYINKEIFSGWFYEKYGYGFPGLLNDPPISFSTSNEPDYTLFAEAVYCERKFSVQEAFCYLSKIPITRSEAQWSQEQNEDYHRFNTFIDRDEKLSPNEIISTAGKANLSIPEEMQIPFNHFNEFFAGSSDRDPQLQEAVNDLHKKFPNLSHEQLCEKLEGTDKSRGKSASRIARLTRSPRKK